MAAETDLIQADIEGYLGRYQDKVLKNHLVTEKTPGTTV